MHPLNFLYTFLILLTTTPFAASIKGGPSPGINCWVTRLPDGTISYSRYRQTPKSEYRPGWPGCLQPSPETSQEAEAELEGEGWRRWTPEKVFPITITDEQLDCWTGLPSAGASSTETAPFAQQQQQQMPLTEAKEQTRKVTRESVVGDRIEMIRLEPRLTECEYSREFDEGSGLGESMGTVRACAGDVGWLTSLRTCLLDLGYVGPV